MKFQNAATGVKRIFTAEILKLIANANSQGGTIAAGVGTVLLIAAASILALIGGIMALVGIINASKDEGAFKTALILIIISLIAAVVGGIFYQNATVQSICQIVQNLSSRVLPTLPLRSATMKLQSRARAF